jgi:hypothetical protein
VAAGAEPPLADTLRAALVRNLTAMAVGQGGSTDPFTAALAKQMAAAEAELTGQG